jgi:glutathione S-transferase
VAELEIIGVAFSNYVRSVRMLCEEKGVAYKHNPAFPQSVEVAAIHPAGQVPVMRHGDLVLFESQAIATYIDKAFPGPKFIPEDPIGAGKVVQWISYGNVKVDRWLIREFVVPSTFYDKTKGPDVTKINAAMPEITKVLAVLDAAIAKSGFLAGNALTFADMNVVPMLVALQRFPAGKDTLSAHPGLLAYMEKITARPSYVNTAPPPRR